jgi:hypothetical protein
LSTSISFKILDDLEDLLISPAYIKENDLLVLVSARKYSVSYLNFLDNIPNKIEKHFTNNNKIVVYPQQYNFLHENREDLTSEPVVNGIETN